MEVSATNQIGPSPTAAVHASAANAERGPRARSGRASGRSRDPRSDRRRPPVGWRGSPRTDDAQGPARVAEPLQAESPSESRKKRRSKASSSGTARRAPRRARIAEDRCVGGTFLERRARARSPARRGGAGRDRAALPVGPEARARTRDGAASPRGRRGSSDPRRSAGFFRGAAGSGEELADPLPSPPETAIERPPLGPAVGQYRATATSGRPSPSTSWPAATRYPSGSRPSTISYSIVRAGERSLPESRRMPPSFPALQPTAISSTPSPSRSPIVASDWPTPSKSFSPASTAPRSSFGFAPAARFGSPFNSIGKMRTVP